MQIIDIKKNNQTEILKEEIIAVQISTLGAMGDAGAINFITKNKKIYYTNMEDEILTISEILDIFPPLKKYQNLFETDEKQYFENKSTQDDWKLIDLGYGNHLIICENLHKKFALQTKKMSPSDIYTNYEKIIENLL